jgi:hypothetical protein
VLARLIEGLSSNQKVPYGIQGGYKDYTLEYAFDDKKLRDQCLKWIVGLVGPTYLQAVDNPKNFGDGDVMHVFQHIDSLEAFKDDEDIGRLQSHHKRYGA